MNVCECDADGWCAVLLLEQPITVGFEVELSLNYSFDSYYRKMLVKCFVESVDKDMSVGMGMAFVVEFVQIESDSQQFDYATVDNESVSIWMPASEHSTHVCLITMDANDVELSDEESWINDIYVVLFYF